MLDRLAPAVCKDFEQLTGSRRRYLPARLGIRGAGFGELGILFDAKGTEISPGNRLTPGCPIGGLGLLLDAAGNDRYISHGFAVGFGGPLGVDAVIDITDDDHYHCDDTYPSAYNAQDAPTGKPGNRRISTTVLDRVSERDNGF